jgi:hypothetical protein
MKPGDTVRINSKHGMPVHATVLRIRGRKARVHDRLGGKYWIAMAMLTVIGGGTLSQHHAIADGFGPAECGWATTQKGSE